MLKSFSDKLLLKGELIFMRLIDVLNNLKGLFPNLAGVTAHPVFVEGLEDPLVVIEAFTKEGVEYISKQDESAWSPETGWDGIMVGKITEFLVGIDPEEETSLSLDLSEFEENGEISWFNCKAFLD